ncbi:hypothetical protein GY21_08530 [Cryobacterium roopkundense]|uniref:Uncharacterized protein n=1 Tax=Cryobacterium roopkundense TaxID=1001240 RepID=A0A099JEQ1_9MICO|nr:hypothetical protein GY21_08530 [Cryobacterium roopkundense]MBB5640507.1 hypothetical protein [Cryobacterium roopkundense]
MRKLTVLLGDPTVAAPVADSGMKVTALREISRTYGHFGLVINTECSPAGLPERYYENTWLRVFSHGDTQSGGKTVTPRRVV